MTTSGTDSHDVSRRGAYAALAALGLYGVLVAMGLPQRWTAAATNGAHVSAAADEPSHASAPHDEEHHGPTAAPPIWTVIPFALLLGAIAVLPLLPATEHWWESNLHRFIVAAGLGLVTLAYYAFLHRTPLELHWPAHAVVAPSAGAVQTGLVATVLINALLGEYLPFIVLLLSLYTIAGGIRITGDLEATPTVNASFMAVGAVLASVIGTTGAAMLLIRPLLETNRERKHVAHTVIFFIFTVCNCGGCLLPLGDPPLFLGYLQGVSFTWTLKLWPEWLFTNSLLLAAYWLGDRYYVRPRETARDIRHDVVRQRRLVVSGAAVNVPLLAGVVLAVALLDPSKPIPGTDWHPWMYLREAVQLGLCAASLLVGSQAPRIENRFNFAAIIEVAALFVGIFICMQPALQILSANGQYLVERFDMGPGKFFWATGALSSFLDNAPTYLVF
ncbi:MAG: hypothetical protein DCC67_02790, partial [Planctomycetota bacterium]